jgi:hypothetical protein
LTSGIRSERRAIIERLTSGILISLGTIERIITSEPWYVTAGVALGAALLGSFVGAFSTYRLNVALDNHHREARAEIRRKAKIYTPIRAELLLLREAISKDEHVRYFTGILREDRGYRTIVNPPELELYTWRLLVQDGRAMSSASARVRTTLDALDEYTEAFNAALKHAGDVFQERGDAIFAELGIQSSLSNWAAGDAVSLIRQRFGDLETFSPPQGQPLDPAIAQRFTKDWESDEEISRAEQRLTKAEAALRKSLDAAITEVESAMRRIAKKHESEPQD